MRKIRRDREREADTEKGRQRLRKKKGGRDLERMAKTYCTLYNEDKIPREKS